jgi:uncharacterized integral membrane protein
MSEPPPDHAPAEEVRVSTYAQRALRRWYVIVLAVIVAVLIVVLHGANSVKGQTDATATVYMGQPVTPGGGALFANPPYANLSAVLKLIESPSARAVAAHAAGVTTQSLSGNVTAHQLSAGGTSTATKTTTGPAYYSIEAQGHWPKRSAAAIANTLAGILVVKASGYVNAKEAALKANIATEQATITRLQAGIATAQALATKLAKSAGSNPSNAAVIATLLSQVSSNTQVISDTQSTLTQNQLSLASATNIEAASISNHATGSTVTAQRKRSSLIVAVVAGLIVGTLLALAWDALRRRQTATPAEANV